MQYRDHTIEFIAPVALAAMINEYAIFGPKLGDRLPSFLGVSLSKHLVEIAFDKSLLLSATVLSHMCFTTTRKRAECGAQFLDEYGGLLKGREMSAVSGFVDRRAANRSARPTIAAVETVRREKRSPPQADRAAASRNRSRSSHSRDARKMRPCW